MGGILNLSGTFLFSLYAKSCSDGNDGTLTIAFFDFAQGKHWGKLFVNEKMMRDLCSARGAEGLNT
jgi:hypothetical protein